jgi:hypothetical protein
MHGGNLKLIDVCICSYMCTFVYIADCKASPVRPIGDVSEGETHQAADVEVTEMLQCK